MLCSLFFHSEPAWALGRWVGSPDLPALARTAPPTPGRREHTVPGRDFLSPVLRSPTVPLARGGSVGTSVYLESVCMSACM